MAKKTESKKTVAKKSPAKNTTTAATSKKTGTKSAAPLAKSSATSNRPAAKSASKVAAPKAASTAKTAKNPPKMKNVLLGGPSRLGSSLGMSSASSGLNLSGASNTNKKKKSQDPVAAAVTKQFGPTGGSKMQGNTAGVGARSQTRRDTKKG